MWWHLIISVGPRLVAVFFIFCAGFVFESLLPVEKITNFHNIALNCVVGAVFRLFEEFSVVWIGPLFFRFYHQGLLAFLAIPDHGSIWRAVGLMFVWLAARDLFYYWFHRLQHGSKWLWAEHALHHSEEHMNITTAIRHHWLEMPLTAVLVNVPLLYLLQPPLITVTAVATILAMTELTNHMNLRLGLGWWNWLFATPQNHRIHHSRLPEHLDKNFAQFFPLWDVLFGTYYAPDKDDYPATGLSSGEKVTGIWQALWLPFTAWWKMLKDRLV